MEFLGYQNIEQVPFAAVSFVVVYDRQMHLI